MASGIKRRTTLGIAGESTYGTDPGSATFVLPVEDYSLDYDVQQDEAMPMLGSTYGVSDIRYTIRKTTFSFTMYVDEDVLPLLLSQKFSISSGAAAGETVVYEHTLTYSNNNVAGSKQSYTLYLDDADVQDLAITGARFDSIELMAEVNGRVKATVAGTGKYLTAGSVTNSVSARTIGFVGRHVGYQLADYGSGLATQKLLSATFKHAFNLSGDDVNYVLGSGDLDALYTTEDSFEADLVARYDSTDLRDDYAADTRKHSEVAIVDTDREVTGSVANTNPSVTITYPVQKIISWSEDGGASDIRKQNFTIKAIDDPAVATAPVEIVIVNATASY